jgi:CheY-like chemotaxis protein
VLTDGTVPGAIAIAEEKSLDFAILDINLGDHTSFAIADRLADLGVPFLFATGYGDQAQLPARHRDRLVLQKPYTRHMIARGLPGVIPGTAPMLPVED